MKILVFILIAIVYLVSLIFNKEKEIYMMDVVNKNIDDVYELWSDYEMDIDISYEYSDTIDKDKVISQSILFDTVINDGDKLDLVVSLGKLDKVRQLLLNAIEEI